MRRVKRETTGPDQQANLTRLPLPNAPKTSTGNTKALIIYYSLTGKTQSVAEKMCERTGGDVQAIKMVRTYPTECPASIQRPKRPSIPGWASCEKNSAYAF